MFALALTKDQWNILILSLEEHIATLMHRDDLTILSKRAFLTQYWDLLDHLNSALRLKEQ